MNLACLIIKSIDRCIKYSENLHKVVTILIDDIDKDNLELIDAYMPRNRHGYVSKV